MLILETDSSDGLIAEEKLLKAVCSSTAAPFSPLLKLDTSQSVISSAYLLLPQPSGVCLEAARPSLSAEHSIRVDLRLGSYLQELHAIENDWFGLPADAGTWSECYSWGECFPLLLETALADAEAHGLPVAFVEVRLALSRAIGFYLFDDVEVPTLVWSPALDWDRDVYVREDSEDSERPITGLCGMGRCIWGDPLMEGAFREPSAALLEGHGGSPILFARQKTKRLWYTFYSALLHIIDLTSRGKDAHSSDPWTIERTTELLKKTAEELQGAPCY